MARLEDYVRARNLAAGCTRRVHRGDRGVRQQSPSAGRPDRARQRRCPPRRHRRDTAAHTGTGDHRRGSRLRRPTRRCRPPSSKRSCRRCSANIVLKPFTGDLDALVKRRLVRVGVTFNRTFYFVDRGVQRGIAYEYAQLVEERLNKRCKTDHRNKVHVVLVPLPRAMLLPAWSAARSTWLRRR
jgi:hypothetical protein